MTARAKAKPAATRAGTEQAASDAAAALARLREMLEGAARGLVANKDTAAGLSFVSKKPYQGRELFVAGVERRRSYVSYYLFPVYMFPELLSGISDALRARMQGKSCFNFKRVDEALFGELTDLTRRCLAAFRDKGLI
jgi:hypothetical protein